MKTLISIMVLALVAGSAQAGDLKIGTVDLQRLMAEYYKAQSTFKALKEKEAACAAFGEVTRKYPKASTAVRQGVDREQKRVHC